MSAPALLCHHPTAKCMTTYVSIAETIYSLSPECPKSTPPVALSMVASIGVSSFSET